MIKNVFFTTALLISCFLTAQQIDLSGLVIDSLTEQPIPGATISLYLRSKPVSADEHGRFTFRGIPNVTICLTVSAVGFDERQVTITPGSRNQIIKLQRNESKLTDVIITSYSGSTHKTLSEKTIRMQGISNSQEILRMVPGLFIGQHQGGGKAEQIFLRGFDADHGSDISIHMDGMPVNLVSHAHAKGYADTHFIIPETINRVLFNKGPYDAEKGDQATAGWLEFKTHDKLSNNTITVEAGQFNTYRILAMTNLSNAGNRNRKDTWYAAAEYNFSNSYFDNPQHFQRFNLFSKYNLKISDKQILTFSASTFRSDWSASGQIPERAVDSGIVSYYGSLDRNEGGITSRTNINFQLKGLSKNGDLIKSQLYFSHCKFDLYSNFTFFLDDPVNGDEIRQRETRNMVGYNGSYLHDGKIGNLKTTTSAGTTIRLDITSNSELSHTINRSTLLYIQKLGNITELGNSAYITQTIKMSEKWTIKSGLRYDYFIYHYNNKINNDPTLRGQGNYKASNYILCPKINITFLVNPGSQIYLSFGKGFHTNDARVVVSENGEQTLPAMYGTDFGILFKPLKNLLIQSAIWFSYLQKEYVYAGDGGTVDFSGKTRRLGADLSTRYHPHEKVYINFDLNYANGRALNDHNEIRYIPLAPVWSSTATFNYDMKTGWNAGLRYRYLSKRPANEDNSLVCQGYFVNDLLIKYKIHRFDFGLIINNLFNVSWKETQFATVTKLKNEPVGVDGISFTPGTRFAAKLTFSYCLGPKSPNSAKE